jgi:hypothetical protein
MAGSSQVDFRVLSNILESTVVAGITKNVNALGRCAKCINELLKIWGNNLFKFRVKFDRIISD